MIKMITIEMMMIRAVAERIARVTRWIGLMMISLSNPSTVMPRKIRRSPALSRRVNMGWRYSILAPRSRTMVDSRASIQLLSAGDSLR